MKNLYKITNISLIFTLVGMFLSPVSLRAEEALRLPLCFQDKKLKKRPEALLSKKKTGKLEENMQLILGVEVLNYLNSCLETGEFDIVKLNNKIPKEAVDRLEEYINNIRSSGKIYRYPEKERFIVIKPGAIRIIAREINCNYRLVPLLFLVLNPRLERQGLNQFILPYDYSMGYGTVQGELADYLGFYQKIQTAI